MLFWKYDQSRISTRVIVRLYRRTLTTLPKTLGVFLWYFYTPRSYTESYLQPFFCLGFCDMYDRDKNTTSQSWAMLVTVSTTAHGSLPPVLVRCACWGWVVSFVLFFNYLFTSNYCISRAMSVGLCHHLWLPAARSSATSSKYHGWCLSCSVCFIPHCGGCFLLWAPKRGP